MRKGKPTGSENGWNILNTALSPWREKSGVRSDMFDCASVVMKRTKWGYVGKTAKNQCGPI